MADTDERGYFVITTAPDGTTAEYLSQHPLDAAMYILQADQRGRTFHVLVMDEDRARRSSLAELARTEASRGTADLWDRARAAWLRDQLAPGRPGGPDWVGAARRWAAAFRAGVPEAVEVLVGLRSFKGWDSLEREVGRLLPLLEHESRWRSPTPMWGWQGRGYQLAWRDLVEASRDAPDLAPTAEFFLSMAVRMDVRSGRISGFAGPEISGGLGQWARAAYSGRTEEATRLYASLTPPVEPLSEEERVWARRWEELPSVRRAAPPRREVRPMDHDTEESWREVWDVHDEVHEEQVTAQYAAFAYLAHHREGITSAVRAGEDDEVVARARRLVRAAFPSEQDALRAAAGRHRMFDYWLDRPDPARFTVELELLGQEWMARHAVGEALRALSPPDALAEPAVPGPAPARMHRVPSVFRVGPDGGYTLTTDPRQALKVWASPRPDRSVQPLIEKSDAGSWWTERSPRSLVAQLRSAAQSANEHWDIDRELARWLLTHQPEGMSWQEIGARWSRYVADVPPRGPVLAWVIRYTSAGPEDLTRLQEGAVDAQLRSGATGEPQAVYHAALERAEAADLAVLDDSEIEERYPGQVGDEMGPRPEPDRQARILASAETGAMQYAHAEFARPRRMLVLARPRDGSSPPYVLGDSRQTDTATLFGHLTSPLARALANAEGTGTVEQAALKSAREVRDREQRARHSLDLRLTLVELADAVRAGTLDAQRYADLAGEVWDQLLLLLEGEAGPAQGTEREWYEIRVAGDDTAMGTLTADPVEALVQWAQDDRPGQQCVILTGTVSSPEVTVLPVGDLLRRAQRRAGVHEPERLSAALAAWIEEVRRSAAAHREADGPDPAAWRQAGWAWTLRIGEGLPPGVRDRLGEAASPVVQDGAREMKAAVIAPLLGWGPGPADLGIGPAGREESRRSALLTRVALRRHWQILAAASVQIPQARPLARTALDHLVALDPAAPVVPDSGEHDAELGRAGARLWFLAKESGRAELMDVFGHLADPSRPSPRARSAFIEALPHRLRERPEAAEEILLAAEWAAAHRALLPLYESYPPVPREERASAASEAAWAMVGRTMAECTRAMATARAREQQPRPEGHGEGVHTPPTVRQPARERDPAQEVARHTRPPPHTPPPR